MPLSTTACPVVVGAEVIARDELPLLIDAADVGADEAVPKTSATGEASMGTGVVASGKTVVGVGVGISVAVFVRVTALMSTISSVAKARAHRP